LLSRKSRESEIFAARFSRPILNLRPALLLSKNYRAAISQIMEPRVRIGLSPGTHRTRDAEAEEEAEKNLVAGNPFRNGTAENLPLSRLARHID
jgi:hypothetical protein